MSLSINNSSSTVLTSGSTFTGIPEDVSAYSNISVMISADKNGTLDVEFTTDNNFSVVTFTISHNYNANEVFSQLIPIRARFCRVKFTNSAGITQGSFELRTIFNKTSSNISCGSHDGGTSLVPLKTAPDGSLSINVVSPLSAFGELLTAEITPLTHIDFQYGLSNAKRTQTYYYGSSANVSANRSIMTADCGTTSGGFAVCHSTRQIKYKTGIGGIARFTSMYGTPIANHQMYAGLDNTTNGFFIGYNGTSFGIMRRYGGDAQISKLTISSGSTAPDTQVTITLNSVVLTDIGALNNYFNMSSYGTLNATQTAYILALLIKASEFDKFWNIQSIGPDIYFVSRFAGTMGGTYSLSTNGTAVGSFTTVATGGTPTTNEVWTTQTNFSDDVLDGSKSRSNPSGMLIDTSKFNVFQIVFQWLGAGQISFYIEDPVTGRFITFHRIKYTNQNTVPIIEHPHMQLAWISKSITSTTATAISGISGFLGIQGKNVVMDHIFSKHNLKTISTTMTNILSIMCNKVFNNKAVNGEMHIRYLCVSGESTNTKAITLSLIANPVHASPYPQWTLTDQYSISSYDTNAGSISGGTELFTVYVTTSSTLVDLTSYNIYLQPGQVLCIAAKSESGSCDTTASLSWIEDF
jgi:hypothetical protein